MREPAFWYRRSSWMSRLLSPLGALYGTVTSRRMQRPGRSVGIPVICIGNYHVGGAGKTPLTLKLAGILRASGEVPFVVSRGYGGSLRGPVRVDPQVQGASDVGDEPLMMAAQVPVIVSRERPAGAALAKSQSASVILLDDGFQNPALVKDISLIVIDGERGIGNGGIFPAGPLRAPLALQMSRTDALVVVGEGRNVDNVVDAMNKRRIPVLRARLIPDAASATALRGKGVLAFAGIGDPARFFATLRQCGADVVEGIGFADHHVFSPSEIGKLAAQAASGSLSLVTTDKDMARIRSASRLAQYVDRIATLPVTLEFEDENRLRGFVTERLAQARIAAI